MPVFNDSENIPSLVPEGDYIFCVMGHERKISKGRKTAGCYMDELKITLEPSGCRVFESLIDHDSCAWKYDTFLKSSGVKIAKGQSFSFDSQDAGSPGLAYVNPLGLRGWCKVIVEDVTDMGGNRTGKQRNRLAVFYTDKEKLARLSGSKPDTAAPAVGDGDDVPF